MDKILKKDFFKSNNTLSITKGLLGKFLVRRNGSKTKAWMITEVEGYDGPEDKASHASRGKTARNEIMFEEGGNWYVYLVYGIHNMLNITTGEEDYPAAILIRGVEGVKGPGRLTKTLEIDRSLNKKPATKKTGIWIEDKGMKINKKDIIKTPRIGVDYAKEWKDAPYRFVLKH